MIKTPLQTIHDICQKALIEAFPDYPNADPIVRPATKEIFGDYQCNGAMKLAKLLNQSPCDVANAIAQKLDRELFSEISVAGSGFINLTLTKNYITDTLRCYPQYLIKGALIPHAQKIIVEYSSPNIAKDMHVGHLRSTIIGDCLAKIFEFLGHEVIKLNHLGDWGTSFGLLIAYMQTHPTEQSETIGDLTILYKKAKLQFDEDENFKNQARHAVVALQSGDPQLLSLWQKIYAVSRESFNAVYSLLNVEIQERGESFYNPFLKKLISDLENKGLITTDAGAKCIFIEGFPIPLIVQKQDGGFNYDTTDMAAMHYRTTKDQAERIIIVTDTGQSLHFNLIKAASQKAGHLTTNMRFDHVVFGLVLDANGKKFKTRSGETIKLIDLLTNSIEQAEALIRNKNPIFPETELKTTARTLGINAIKYADLSCNRIHDYVFSFEKMLRFEGKTATFILYSYVRIQGIKRKMGLDNKNLASISNKEDLSLLHPAERTLGMHLIRFPEVLLKTAEDLFPNHLADYLYELAEKFNIFFRECHIHGSEHQRSRLQLSLITETALKAGMALLGLETVNQL